MGTQHRYCCRKYSSRYISKGAAFSCSFFWDGLHRSSLVAGHCSALIARIQIMGVFCKGSCNFVFSLQGSALTAVVMQNTGCDTGYCACRGARTGDHSTRCDVSQVTGGYCLPTQPDDTKCGYHEGCDSGYCACIDFVESGDHGGVPCGLDSGICHPKLDSSESCVYDEACKSGECSGILNRKCE